MRKKYLTTFFLIVLFSASFFVLTISRASAITDYKLDMPFSQGQQTVSSLGQYIQMFFIFGLSLVGIVALFAVVFGGINYLVSGSSETRKTEGKRWIYAAISGIILLLFSYLIFATLNPELISLKEPVLEQGTQTGAQSSPFQLEMPLTNSQAPQTPGEYVQTFFIFGLGLVGIIALFGIVFGGIQYLLSAGNASLKTYGRQWIVAALSGLVLLLCSYLILATINPSLVNLSLPSLNSSPAPAATQIDPLQLEMPLSGAGQSASDIGQYIKSFFIFGLGIAGVAALFAIVFGGLNYIFSGSSQTRATEGKRWLAAAISGLGLLLISFLILNTINPELTALKEPNLNQSAQTGTQSSPFQLEMPFSSGQQTNTTPGGYIKLFFIYGLGIVGVAGLFGVAFGGLNYIFSGSSQTRATEGKQWIFSAISGIALLLCSYLILFTINPDLISLKDPNLAVITIPPHTGFPPTVPNNELPPYVQTPPGSAQNCAALINNFGNLINQYADQYGVDRRLAAALIMQESRGNPRATSPAGAMGLMQLMPGTAARFGVTDPYDPAQSIRGGLAYFSWLLNRYNGDVNRALAGYNCGEGCADRRWPDNLPNETRQFFPGVHMWESQCNDMGALLNFFRDISFIVPVRLSDKNIISTFH